MSSAKGTLIEAPKTTMGVVLQSLESLGELPKPPTAGPAREGPTPKALKISHFGNLLKVILCVST